MNLSRSGRFVFVAQWVFAVLLPVFFFIGRGFVGAEMGWLAVIGVVYGLVVIVVLLLPPVLTLCDREVRRARRTRTAYDVASWVLWAAFVVAALTVPDAGDGGHLDTALTTWTGGAVDDAASTAIYSATAWVIGLAYLATFVIALVGIARVRKAAQDAAPEDAASAAPSTDAAASGS